MNTIIAQSSDLHTDSGAALQSTVHESTMECRDGAQLVFLEASELAFVGGGNLAHNY